MDVLNINPRLVLIMAIYLTFSLLNLLLHLIFNSNALDQNESIKTVNNNIRYTFEYSHIIQHQILH